MSTRLALLLLVPVLALAGPGGRPGADRRAAAAEAELLRGAALEAMAIARKCFEESPGAMACRDVFVRAGAVAGRCAPVVPEALLLRHTRWATRAVLSAEASCRQRIGDAPGADVAFSEAIDLDPSDPAPWFQRALMHVRLGWAAELAEDRRHLAVVDTDGWRQDVVDAWVALESGDPNVDGLIHRFVSSHHCTRPGPCDAPRDAKLQVAIVACQRALDVGDPTAAEAFARDELAITRGHARLVACRVEALRRLSRPEEALRLATRPGEDARDQPLVDAVVARVLVDLGRLDEAQALLATAPDPLDPEVMLSRWYVATRTDDPHAATLASWASRLTPSAAFRIERLVLEGA